MNPATGKDRSDAGLVERLRAGDEAAFAELVGRYHGRLRRLALVYVHNPAVAEDVVQDTWLGVLNGLRAFEGRSSLKTWIFRILTNQARSRAQREGRTIPFADVFRGEDEPEPAVEPDRFARTGMWARPPLPWGGPAGKEHLLRKETVAFLEQAIADLPPAQRAVVILRDIEGLASREVCNVLDLSETNQRVLLHRGRSRLRRALGGYLGKE